MFGASALQDPVAEEILQSASVIFNKKGYVATTISDLEDATGKPRMTIYRKFETKEALAILSFKRNINRALGPVFQQMKGQKSAVQKLDILIEYYRNYDQTIREMGGCPLLRIGVDTKHTNPGLFKIAQKIGRKLKNGLVRIIEQGIEEKTFSPTVDADQFANLFIAVLEGGIFLTGLHNQYGLMDVAASHLTTLVEQKLQV